MVVGSGCAQAVPSLPWVAMGVSGRGTSPLGRRLSFGRYAQLLDEFSTRWFLAHEPTREWQPGSTSPAANLAKQFTRPSREESN